MSTTQIPPASPQYEQTPGRDDPRTIVEISDTVDWMVAGPAMLELVVGSRCTYAGHGSMIDDRHLAR